MARTRIRVCQWKGRDFCLLFKYSSLRCDPPYHTHGDPVLNVSPIPLATEDTDELGVPCHSRGSTHSPPTVQCKLFMLLGNHHAHAYFVNRRITIKFIVLERIY